MDLRDYVRLLRRRWRLIALCTVLAVAAATAATLAQPKVYTAQVQLFVSAQDRAGGAGISSAYTGGLFTQERVKSYVDIITSERAAALVRDRLRLTVDPAAIAKEISASAPLDTVLIDVAVKDRQPARAQQIADAVGTTFPALVSQLEQPLGGGPSPIKVTMVQSAQLPIAPTSPRPALNLALGLLVGLAIGVGGAVLRETLDTTIKTPDEAEDLVGAPVLGAFTYDREAAKRPLVVQVSPSSPRSEAFRQMRTNLQFVDIQHSLRSVIITSSVAGEGKSTTTCNLAITLAQAGVRVLLIEGDLRRPRIADYMGLEGAVGLTSVLLGHISLDDALQPWGDGGLEVLASGPLPPNPSELLGSAGMSELLRKLEARFDLVLIDAPPLLPVTDAAVLGAIGSGVLILIRSNATRREQVARAAATVNAVGATILGAILNMVPSKGPDAYAYGYGGRYDSQGSGTGHVGRDEAQNAVGASARSVRAPSGDSTAPTAAAQRSEPSTAPELPGADPAPSRPVPPLYEADPLNLTARVPAPGPVPQPSPVLTDGPAVLSSPPDQGANDPFWTHATGDRSSWYDPGSGSHSGRGSAP
ncbi:MAG: polysaccharide biosynthesis tyrosine autokinase [Mycobacteriales bacterium]